MESPSSEASQSVLHLENRETVNLNRRSPACVHSLSCYPLALVQLSLVASSGERARLKLTEN